MTSTPITIDPELAGKVALGVLVLRGVSVRAEDEGLQAEVERYAAAMRERHGGGRSGEVPGAEQARALYKLLGLDPTKTRPASEALMRRVLKGEGLYRINTLVDALNLCSLRAQLPFGLYDLARLAPPVTLRRGRAGEGYEGIRKAFVGVEGRPVLVDAQGAFGNPTSDSQRAMIRLETADTLVIAYAPRQHDGLSAAIDETERTLTRWCGGSTEEKRIID